MQTHVCKWHKICFVFKFSAFVVHWPYGLVLLVSGPWISLPMSLPQMFLVKITNFVNFFSYHKTNDYNTVVLCKWVTDFYILVNFVFTLLSACIFYGVSTKTRKIWLNFSTTAYSTIHLTPANSLLVLIVFFHLVASSFFSLMPPDMSDFLF